MTHDITLICRDGSVRSFRVYDRQIPSEGDVITLPVDGHLTEARVSIVPGELEIAQSVEAKAIQI